MATTLQDPAAIIAKQLQLREPKDRQTFLRDLLAHTAATLTVIEGRPATAEILYRTADATVSNWTGGPDGHAPLRRP